MIRNSIHTYNFATDLIGNLPDRSIVQVENSTIFIQVISKGSATTIQHILDGVGTSSYIDLNIAERAGFEYDPLTQYVVGDLVTFNGMTYYSITGSIGIDPIPGASVAWGSQRTTNTYNPGIAYEPGEMIVVGDDIYVAPAGGIPPAGITPGAPSSLWLLSTPDEVGGIVWSANNSYIVGDSVYDSLSAPGALYICTASHTSVAGNDSDGAPQQSLSINWTDTITADPGTF